MITFRLALWQAEESYARQLIDEIKKHPGCCDTVWLTTMGYYPPLWRHEKYAADWVASAEMFREAGLEVSIQIANTIGHTDCEQLDPKNDDFFMWGMRPREGEDPYLVGPDGTKNSGCFCWRSPQFREYINSVMRIYAGTLKPSRFWFDDDLRAHNHSPNAFGCYCDRCIGAFNAKYGTEYGREELVRKINYEDVSLRRKYIDFCREGLYEFTYGAARACIEASPETTLGFEYEHERIHDYLGGDDLHILDALHDASGKEIHTRPGGGYYNDKSPWGQFEKSVIISEVNSTLPSYVTECVAEVENLPGVVYGKSIGGIINEGTLDMAIGCTGLTFTDVQSCHEPMSYYGRIFDRFAKMRPYWERLSYLSKNAFRGGVVIYKGEAPELRPLSEDQPLCAWEKALVEKDVNFLRLGIPLTHDQRAPSAYIVHHDTVDALTDADIEFLLTKPVITDGESVAKICARGYADRFALTPVAVDNNTEEHFTECHMNGDKAGIFYNENPYAASPMQRYIFKDLDERTQVSGEMYRGYHLGDGSLLGACTLVTETENGGKWAIFGYSLWSDIVSSAKRNQIVAALDEIGPMPVRLLSEEQAVVIPSVDEEESTLSVTVASVSQNGTDELVLRVRRPKGRKITTMGTRRNDIAVKIVSDNGEELTLSIDALVPYEFVTLFFEVI